MKDTNILLIRHGDVHNPEQIMYGRLPRFRLNPHGENQARTTAEALANEPISVFYTSPILRARQTTRVLAKYHPDAPVKTSNLITEVQTGWQGERWSRIPANANLYEKRVNPGDESMEDVADRVSRFLQRVLRLHAGETVACVSHADTIMFAKAVVLGRELTLQNIRQPDYPEHTSITRLIFDANGQLENVKYESPAKGLITPAEREKKEAPAEAAEPASVS